MSPLKNNKIVAAIIRHKLYLYYALGIIIIGLLLETFGFHHVFWMDAIQNKLSGCRSMQYQLDQADPRGYAKQPDGSWLSLSSNPEMFCKDINQSVRRIMLQLDAADEQFTVDVQLTKRPTASGNDMSIVTQHFDLSRAAGGSYLLTLTNIVDAKDISLKIGNHDGFSFHLNAIALNPITQGFGRFSFSRFLVLAFLLSCIACVTLLKDQHLNKLLKWRYALAGALLIVMVAGQVNFSSIGVWNSVFTDTLHPANHSDIWGKARSIRSDEWLVSSPYSLSQAMAPGYFEELNTQIRSDGLNMSLFGGPVSNILLLARPSTWGYLLLGRDFGFSWSFCFPLLALFMTSLEMCLLLTKRNVRLSLVGAFWITLAPAIQWWSANTMIIWMQGFIVSLAYYIECDKKQYLRKLGLAAIILVSISSFVLNFYPAWQVPFGYMTLLLTAYVFLSKRKQIRFGWVDYALIAAVFIGVAAEILYFLRDTKAAYAIMSNTAYPGARFELGGTYPAGNILSDITMVKLPFSDIVPAQFGNQSEGSQFLSFLPFVFLAVPIALFTGKRDRGLLTALLVYLVANLLWLVVPFPAVIAKYSLYYNVMPSRLVVPIGLCAVYLCLLTTNIFQREAPLGKGFSVAFGFIVAIVYCIALIKTPLLDYLGLPLALVMLAVYGIIVVLLSRGQARPLSAVLLSLIFVCGAYINPIARTLDPIYNKQVSKEVQSIVKQDPDGKWIGVSNLVYGQYLVANGAKTINGVHYYPDIPLWKKLDPDGKYTEQYNRYAHVVVFLTKDPTSFETPQPDVCIVHLNVDMLSEIGGKYIMAQFPLDQYQTDRTKFKTVYSNAKDGIYISEVISGT